MMQNVQRWSQPFCTWTKARVRPEKASIRWAAVSLTAMMSLTIAFGASFKSKPARACAQDAGSSFSALPSTRSASAMAMKVCGSVCAAQPVTTILAESRSPRSAPIACRASRDRLPRLADRFGGDGAGVDHHGVVKTGALGFAADHFRLGRVEPAAEGDDLDAHGAASAAANKAASKWPLCSYSVGPGIRAWPSGSRQR